MYFDTIIYNEAIKQGMPPTLANLIVAQAKHETGNFTSNVFKTCNNAFGYKHVGQKLSLGPCGNPPANEGAARYAKYQSVSDSTKEICQWIKRRQSTGVFPANLASITSPAQYAQLLKAGGYYGDTVTNYTNALIKFFKDNIAPAAGISAGVILALGVFFC